MNQEKIAETLFYIKGTLKYRWVALLIAWVICVGGWVIVDKLPDKYVSEARVHVDTETMLQPLLKGMTVKNNMSAQIELMRQLMFTHYNLAEIARLAEIDTVNMEPLERVEYFDDLKEDISINGSRKSPIFFISYANKDPQLAKKIVNAVLTVFSEKSQKSNYSDVDNARRFINEQIAEYETRLRNAEKAREEFRRINFGMLPEDTVVGVMGKIDRLMQDRESAELSLNESNSKRTTIEKQLQEALVIGDTSMLPDVETPEDIQIKELNDKKTLLLLRYTDNHPDVLAVNQAIAEWEKNREKNRVLADQEEHEDALIMEHPYITDLKSALNQIEAQEASERARMTVIAGRIKKLEEEQTVRLHVETELQSLNRDYDTLAKNYEQLVQRREQVNISKNIDDKAISLRFNVADPPNKPLKPTEPNRPVLVSSVYGVGLVFGFGIAFLIYFLRPTFVTTRQISMQTGLPVLGGVSMQGEGRFDNFNASTIAFYLTFSLLTFIFLILFSVEMAKVFSIDYLDILSDIKQLSVMYLRDLF